MLKELRDQPEVPKNKPAPSPRQRGRKVTPADEIELQPIQHESITVRILGTSPLIYNRMTAKAKRAFLWPRGRLNATDKATHQKHDPLEEYRDSAHKWRHDDHPTRLYMPAPAFKGCMLTAALDMPGVFKRQIGRQLWVEGHDIDIYGVPELRMDIVRMADIARTPDIRTRACLPEWAAELTVSYSTPLLNGTKVANLLAGGGIMSGVGDFRQEKGAGNHGQFTLVNQSLEKEWLRIVKSQGREAQDVALKEPCFFNEEAEDLFVWFEEKRERRGREAQAQADAPAAAPKKRGRPKKAA